MAFFLVLAALGSAIEHFVPVAESGGNYTPFETDVKYFQTAFNCPNVTDECDTHQCLPTFFLANGSAIINGAISGDAPGFIEVNSDLFIMYLNNGGDCDFFAGIKESANSIKQCSQDIRTLNDACENLNEANFSSVKTQFENDTYSSLCSNAVYLHFTTPSCGTQTTSSSSSSSNTIETTVIAVIAGVIALAAVGYFLLAAPTTTTSSFAYDDSYRGKLLPSA